MGGTTDRCEQVLFRGRYICKHSLPKYQKLAKGIGNAIYFWLVQGSYSLGALSANTHAGGGAGDQELDGYSFAQGRACETYARNECDLLYLLRWWRGNCHGHILDPECPNLSSAAAAQFLLWEDGYDALVGNNPDTGSRANVSRIMTLFRNRNNPVVPAPTTTTVRTNFYYPYGKFKVPGQPGSMYGPSTAGKPWYSGRVAGGSNRGPYASGYLMRWWIRDHISEIQRAVGLRNPDGIYGPWTANAVKEFQRSKRLTADGVVGPQTWRELVKVRNAHTL